LVGSEEKAWIELVSPVIDALNDTDHTTPEWSDALSMRPHDSINKDHYAWRYLNRLLMHLLEYHFVCVYKVRTLEILYTHYIKLQT